MSKTIRIRPSVVRVGPFLVEAPRVKVRPAPLTHTQRFEKFHNANPDFYDLLVERAREYMASTGSKLVGMQHLIEVARWDQEVHTKSTEFKVNNNFAPFYARLLMAQNQNLEGAFPLRNSPEADRWIESLFPKPKVRKKRLVVRRKKISSVAPKPRYL